MKYKDDLTRIHSIALGCEIDELIERENKFLNLSKKEIIWVLVTSISSICDSEPDIGERFDLIDYGLRLAMFQANMDIKELEKESEDMKCQETTTTQ